MLRTIKKIFLVFLFFLSALSATDPKEILYPLFGCSILSGLIEIAIAIRLACHPISQETIYIIGPSHDMDFQNLAALQIRQRKKLDRIGKIFLGAGIISITTGILGLILT